MKGAGLTRTELGHVAGLSGIFMMRMLGLFLVLPVLSVHALTLEGSSPLLAGMAVGFYGLSQTLFTVPMGLLSDRLGRKPVIAAGLLLYAFGSVVAATSGGIGQLLLGRFLQGAGAISSAVIALAADLTREEVRGRAMAVMGISIGVSFTLGLGLGPVLSARWGVPSLFWTTAALDLVAIAYLFTMVPTPAREKPLGVSWSHVGDILRDRNLFALDELMFLLHMGLTAVWVVTPKLLLAHWDRGELWKVYLPMIVVAGGVMLPSVAIAESKKKLKELLYAGIAVSAAGWALMGASGADAAATALGLIIFFVGFNLIEPILPSLVTRFAPKELRGTAVGVFNTSQFLGSFCGGTLGGYFLGHGRHGLYWTLLALAVPWAWAALRLARPPERAAAA